MHKSISCCEVLLYLHTCTRVCILLIHRTMCVVVINFCLILVLWYSMVVYVMVTIDVVVWTLLWCLVVEPYMWMMCGYIYVTMFPATCMHLQHLLGYNYNMIHVLY